MTQKEKKEISFSSKIRLNSKLVNLKQNDWKKKTQNAASSKRLAGLILGQL